MQNIFISAVFKKDVCRLTTLYNQYGLFIIQKATKESIIIVELQNISFFTKNETDDVPWL